MGPGLYAGQAQQGQVTVESFQKLEDAWSVALVNKDQFAMENLFLPTFIDVSAKAQVNTRNQLIADTIAGLPEPLLSVEQKVVNVRVVSDMAVVEGTYILRMKEEQRTRDERGIFTHVYQRSRNNWSCISSQRTAVVDQLENAKGNRAAAAAGDPGKKSNAALPFHIPLIYGGKTSTAPAATAATPPATPPQ